MPQSYTVRGHLSNMPHKYLSSVTPALWPLSQSLFYTTAIHAFLPVVHPVLTDEALVKLSPLQIVLMHVQLRFYKNEVYIVAFWRIRVMNKTGSSSDDGIY
jgi:hypothetical protein